MNNPENNKARIALKALELFIMYGIRRVSMNEIALSMGMSKKTIYIHYHDKEALVTEVVRVVLDKNFESCETNKENASNAIHESFLAIDQTADLFRRMNPIIMHDLEKYYPKAYNAFRDYKNEFLFETLRQNIQKGVTEGFYRDDFNIDLIVRFRLRTVMEVFSPEIYLHTNMALGKIHEELFYNFLFSLATPKGYKLIDTYRKERNKI